MPAPAVQTAHARLAGANLRASSRQAAVRHRKPTAPAIRWTIPCPLIIVVAVGVALWGMANPGAAVAEDVADLVNSSPMINQWWVSGVLYVAFNFQLAYAVLAPVGRISSSRPATLAAGAGLGAIIAMLTAGLFEYNFGDSEFLMLFLGLITLPFASRSSDDEPPELFVPAPHGSTPPGLRAGAFAE